MGDNEIIEIDIDTGDSESLLIVLEGIREAKAHILSKYSVRTRGELEDLIDSDIISYYDASIDLLRLDIMEEMENTVLELLREEQEKPQWMLDRIGVLAKRIISGIVGVKKALT